MAEMTGAGGFTIKVVAQRTGVPLHTLRAWERRYGVPKPNRAPDNHYRLYDENDIADVLWMKRQVDAGLPPSQASALLRARGRTASLPLLTGSAQPLDAQAITHRQQTLMAALLEQNVDLAQRLLDETLALLTPEQVVLHILEPTMRGIGERWVEQRSDVWHEHLSSNFMRQRLLTILQAQAAPPPFARKLIAACAPEEQHELGLLTFVLLMRRQGWNVTYLGQRTPLADLQRAHQILRPQLVSVTLSSVVGLTSLIPLLADDRGLSNSLTFGGHLFTRVPALRSHMPGHFVAPDAISAVACLNNEKLPRKHWRPARKHLQAALALQGDRLTLAGATVECLLAIRPQADKPMLNQVSLYLIDTLSCALAFETPELMDAEAEWLQQAMPPRAVQSVQIVQHLDACTSALTKHLPSNQTRLVLPLLQRMRERSLREKGEG